MQDFMVKRFLKLQILTVFLVFGSILNAEPYSLTKVSQYLSNLKFLTAEFSQINDDGTTSSGIIFIRRPGSMRFEYYKPDKNLILISAGVLAIFDPKGDQTPIMYPITNNPISFILNDEVDLLNAGIVENYEVYNDKAILTLKDPNKPDQGNIQIVFSGAKPELAQFIIKNANGSSTSLSLKDIEYPKKINATLFSIALETKRRQQIN